MTSVHFALFRDGPDGRRPVSGTLGFCRTKRGVDGQVTMRPARARRMIRCGGRVSVLNRRR